MRIFQINVEANYGSTGKIAEVIGNQLIANGDSAYLAHGRHYRKSDLETHEVGHKLAYGIHLLLSRFFDGQGLGSYFTTKKLVSRLKSVKPDLIHLHNIHGYFLNYKVLFKYLQQSGIPVVWTLHDCWAFTGHCVHFEPFSCDKWKTLCNNCPAQKSYPINYGLDRSRFNYKRKKELFAGLTNLHLVSVSKWLQGYVKHSFLKDKALSIITNGVDLSRFDHVPNKKFEGKKVLLAVASVWEANKGYEDFLKLNGLLHEDELLVMVGLNKIQLKELPERIFGIERTSNVEELVALYSRADCFLNFSYSDSYPTTIMEAMACGTQVITYETGGCVEMVEGTLGGVVPKGNFEMALNMFRQLLVDYNSETLIERARAHAITQFDFKHQVEDYLALYRTLVID